MHHLGRDAISAPQASTWYYIFCIWWLWVGPHSQIFFKMVVLPTEHAAYKLYIYIYIHFIYIYIYIHLYIYIHFAWDLDVCLKSFYFWTDSHLNSHKFKQSITGTIGNCKITPPFLDPFLFNVTWKETSICPGVQTLQCLLHGLDENSLK